MLVNRCSEQPDIETEESVLYINFCLYSLYTFSNLIY